MTKKKKKGQKDKKDLQSITHKTKRSRNANPTENRGLKRSRNTP